MLLMETATLVFIIQCNLFPQHGALSQDNIVQYANEMVQAMLQLLQNCSPEVASLRKELLIAVRHILATDLKTRE